MNNDELLNDWKKRVLTKVDKIDPNKERHWESLAFGYFLASTSDITRAKNLAYEVWKQNLLGRMMT